MKREERTWARRPLGILIIVFALISLVLIGFAIVVALELLGITEIIGVAHPSDPGLTLATAALALFTALLFFAGVLAASYARREITTTAQMNAANLALQMDNRFHSDRALRIRHGAVTFLAATKEELSELEPKFDCNGHNISPYSIDQKPWHGLNSDLIDIFNYYDWIGYLVSEKPHAIDEEVVYQKFGPWIINYYQICRKDIKAIQDEGRARWPYLKTLYERLIEVERARYPKDAYAGEERTQDELKDFLQREHVRGHRGGS